PLPAPLEAARRDPRDAGQAREADQGAVAVLPARPDFVPEDPPRLHVLRRRAQQVLRDAVAARHRGEQLQVLAGNVGRGPSGGCPVGLWGIACDPAVRTYFLRL